MAEYQLRGRRRVQTGARVAVGALYFVNRSLQLEGSGAESGELAGLSPNKRSRGGGSGDGEQGYVGGVLRRQAAPWRGEIAEPPTQPSEGSAVWKDDGTLQWETRPARQTVVPGFVSVQVDAYAKGAQPQDRQLVMVEPKASYDMETGAELGIARGAQWWYPGTPL